jgi:hypothetical protein
MRRSRRLEVPDRIAVAPYHYLATAARPTACRSPASNGGLDAQGDKIMRGSCNAASAIQQSIVAEHSIDTARRRRCALV